MTSKFLNNVINKTIANKFIKIVFQFTSYLISSNS